MKRIAISALLILLSLSLLPELLTAQQQGVPADGKDFYLGFVMPSFNKNPGLQGRDFHGFFGVYALVSSYEGDNLVKVSYFDGSGKEIQSKSVILQAKSAIQIALDKSSMQMTEPGDIPEYKACHITSKKPVNVQYFSTGASSGGSYLSIPTPALGKSYVIPSYYDNPGTGAAVSTQAENAGGFFLIVAAFDGTNVVITPNETTAGGHTGVNSGALANGTQHPYSVSLTRGQCYWVKGDGSDNGNDISGSIVVSDKPIAVLAGHEDAFFGDVGTRVLEARDFMIEQVIPAEYWDSTGYVSMPLKDGAGTQGGDAGYGENYRVYTNDPRGAAVLMSDCNVALNAMSVSRLPDPTPENNTGCPVEFHSADGHKFGVMMYDLRDQGSGAPPHPCESMMSIVPMSRWRTSFLFYVPANTFEILQNYYINIIAEKGDIDNGYIQFAFNGSQLKRLNGLSTQGTYKQIPFHPELEGSRFGVSPGAYYITNTRPASKIPDPLVPIDTMLRGAFMVYHYGMRAIDPDHDLGDFCGDDYFFSYALPIGMTLSAGGGDPHVKVDTFCSSWHVCVTDTGDVTIRSVTLLDDPDGNYYRPGKKFYNVHFDPALDPDDSKEIVFTGDNKKECFDVIVSNPLDTAYAPLYIVDSKGTHTVVEMRYKAPSVQLTKLPDRPSRLDTLKFPILKIGDHICDTLLYINTAATGGKAFSVSGVALKKNDPNFTIGWISPALPASLQAGDTLKVEVCFSPLKDTLAHNDSVILTTDCFKAPLPIVGKGGTPLIYATDWDFGNVTVGTTVCHDIIVSNRGTLPFLLTKNWKLHNTTLFSMSPASAARLPITIAPGGFVILSFCYTPAQLDAQDSTNVDWSTDISKPFDSVIKPWSFLKGKPVKPGVTWDRLTQLDSVICDDSVVVRVYLANTSNRLTHVTQVLFEGADAAEYHIRADQLGYYPLANFDLDTGARIWVDVAFKADLSKTGAAKYADRHATIVARFENEKLQIDSTVIDFTGKVQHAILVGNPATLDFGFVTRGTPTTGFVTLINTGDAPYIISSVNFPNPPITGILYKGKILSPGDSIGRGDTVTIEIDGKLDTFSDTTVIYNLNSTKECSSFTASVHIASSSLKVTATDFPAQNTFVGCREYDSTVTATNLGSVKVTLESIEIISTPATPNAADFDLVDAGGKQVKIVTFNKLLSHLESVTVPIVYHPSVAGPVSATIVYHWDSSGTKFDSTKIAKGIGVLLKTTLSAAQAGVPQYTAPTQGTFNVPLSLANTALPIEALLKRITFRLTYRRDVVDYDPVNRPATPAANYQFVNPPVVTELPNGDEAIDFNITNKNGSITTLESLAQVNFESVVSKELVTPFIISNVAFFDTKDQSICYINHDTIPGVFVPQYLCGDTSLHRFLLGVLPTRINMLSPNVIGEDETTVLYYSVNRADVPVKVEVYNVLGEMVRTIKNTVTQPVGSYKLPIGTMGLQSGTYTVRLTTPSSSETANFILHK